MNQKGFSVVILLIIILVITLLALVYIFLAHPYKVFGSPIQPFRVGETILGEKISYLFTEPKIGDRITFQPNKDDGDYIGIITKINSNDNYEVSSSTGKNPWKITSSQITSRIYYPTVSEDEIKQIISQLPKQTEVQNNSSLTNSQTTQPSIQPSQIPTSSYNTSTTPQPTIESSPTIPSLKKITVSGFTYEDRNDDGLFNSDDPKIPYMSFLIYDSYEPSEQISTLFSESDGTFSITLEARRGLILQPTTYNNFRPRGGQQQFSGSTTGIQFGFRSASAPVINQSGIIEGDIFQDNNQNGSRDSGEVGIYFYKLYLIDGQGNYFENSTQNAQATDAGGHFKYMNLPLNRNYTLRLSNPTGNYVVTIPDTTINLTNANPQKTNLQIPVYKR